MQIERKALYNLLRMNWLNDPNISSEPWQVEDYRNLPTQTLFQNLNERGIALDNARFINFTEMVDSPEDFTEILLEDTSFDLMEQDRIFLHIFELWRRLVPEKLCLSIFCDELDHQIYLYDSGDPSSAESIQDAIANLQMILDENFDQGMKPSRIFESVSAGCANDLESFLYDFTAEQINNDNIVYASELLDGFGEYLKGSKWLELLNIHFLEKTDPESVQEPLKKMVLKAVKEEDLQFNLELLSLIAHAGEHGEFHKMVKKTVPLLKTEEDFQDFLTICGNFYRYLDEDSKEQAIQSILDERLNHPLSNPIEENDPDVTGLLKIVK